MQTGQLVFDDGKDRHSIRHGWVEVGGHILDLTVNHQSWGNFHIARLIVDDSRLRYQPGAPDPAHELAATWQTGSKPADRPPYTQASLNRQTVLIRKFMPRDLYKQRARWICAVRAGGIIEGSYRWLLEMTA
jgi:hypothetical protein